MAFSPRTIILPASQKDLANQWMQDNVDPQGGINTFSVPYTNNNSSITHYVSIGNWTDDQAADLDVHFGAKCYDEDPQTVLTRQELVPYVPLG